MVRRRAAWAVFLTTTLLVALAFAIACSPYEAETTPQGEEAAVPDARVDSTSDVATRTDAGCSPSVATDPLNCGSCGHSCLGGGCDGGRCEPQRIATASVKATTIVTTPSGVHWIARGTSSLWKCPLAGCSGAPAALSASLVDTQSLVAAGEELLVLCTASLQRVSAEGATAEVRKGFSEGRDIGVHDDGFVYFRATEGTAKILRVFLDGGSPGPIVDDDNLESLGVGNNRLAFIVGSPDSIVVCDSVAACGGGRKLVTFSNDNATRLAFTSTDVFYARPNELGKCAFTGCATRSILLTEPDVEEIATDATHFWFLRKTKGEVVRCPHQGCSGNPEVVATTKTAPQALHVNGNAVYWSSGGGLLSDGGTEDPAVWRIVK